MTTVAPPRVLPSRPSFLARHQFLIYRLFSLRGLVPVGAYLCIHLVTNAAVLGSPSTFQSQVDSIHNLGILLPIVEWTFIFIPILFHAVVGWLIISGAMPNNSAYPYPGNLRFTLQRVTAIIIFFFILFHVLHMHKTLGGPFEPVGGAAFDPEHAASSAGRALQGSLWIQIVYAVGVLASAYHLANGLWTFGLTWGIWTSPAAMRRANYISLVFGVALAAVGLAALVGMIRVDVGHAYKIETQMQQAKRLTTGEIGDNPVEAPQ